MCSDTIKTLPAEVQVQLSDLIRLKAWVKKGALVHRKPKIGVRLGAHTAKRQGQGMSFEEVRAYSPQDDLRLVDWKVTARTGQPHTKVFSQDAELPLLLALDTSESMNFGTRNVFKSVLAARCASLLAWQSIQQDPIKFVRFNKQGFQAFKVCQNKSSLVQSLSQLCEPLLPTYLFDNQTQSTMVQALTHVRCQIRGGWKLVLLTDLYDWNDDAKTLLKWLSLKYHLWIIWVQDVMEVDMPNQSQGYFTDTLKYLLPSKEDAKAYQRYYQQRCDEISSYCFQHNIQLSEVYTNDTLSVMLKKLGIK